MRSGNERATMPRHNTCWAINRACLCYEHSRLCSDVYGHMGYRVRAALGYTTRLKSAFVVRCGDAHALDSVALESGAETHAASPRVCIALTCGQRVGTKKPRILSDAGLCRLG